jgi:hypothetical protein
MSKGDASAGGALKHKGMMGNTPWVREQAGKKHEERTGYERLDHFRCLSSPADEREVPENLVKGSVT